MAATNKSKHKQNYPTTMHTTEFWESSFRANHEMWGWKPADSTVQTLALFKKYDLQTLLVPGFGYGRNAKVFIDEGFTVTGIEISATAIDIAKQQFGESVKVHHGSVSSMPFDQALYDGIFCYALIHLLCEKERRKLIEDCYQQLKPNGYMVFVALSKEDFRYGRGKPLSKDTYEPFPGVAFFFYDADSITSEYGDYGLIDTTYINEPIKSRGNKLAQRFWYIVCKK